MRIGIIGAGNVGGTLGTAWSRLGHDVVFALRNPDDPKSIALLHGAPDARGASTREAAQVSDVLLVATPWEATQQALADAGDLTGKVVIDATNPLLPGLAGLSIGTTTSGAEQVAQWARGASVVKAFNTVGFNVMENPHFPQGKAVMFYCGDDSRAKDLVRELALGLGFDAQDAGPLTQARALEPFAYLWISLAMKYGYSRDIGFQLLRR